MKKVRSLLGILVALACILAAAWMFPAMARAEGSGEDVAITEIHVDDENHQLILGKSYRHTTMLSGPFFEAMEIVEQKWINNDDPTDVIATANTDALKCTVGATYSYSVTLRAKDGYRFQKVFSFYNGEIHYDGWDEFDVEIYHGSISEDGKEITITGFTSTVATKPTVLNAHETLKLKASVKDNDTDTTKNYSTQDTWTFDRLDTDSDGFWNLPGAEASAKIDAAMAWAVEQTGSESDVIKSMDITNEYVIINGDTENPIYGGNFSYYQGDTVDRYYTVEVTIEGSIPKKIREVQATITTTFEPGKTPTISATCATEGVELDCALWMTHIENPEESEYSEEDVKLIYSRQEYNDELGDQLLTEVLTDTEYDLGISFYIKDLMDCVFADKVTLKVNGETYVAEGDEIYGKWSLWKILKTVKFDSDTKSGWKKSAKGWSYYVNYNAVTGWKQLSKKWYYFDKNGIMATGWTKVGKTWYYFSPESKTLGAMITGWKQIGKKWYYFSPETKTLGAMITGWKKIGKEWYYFSPASKTLGEMASGWKQIGKDWYFFKSGVMKTGWLKSGGVWYYFNANGIMVTGSRKIGNKIYNFNSSGVCLNP